MIQTGLKQTRNHKKSKEMIHESQEQRTCKYDGYQLCQSRFCNRVLPNNTWLI